MTALGDLGPWLALALLGAYHGLNPAMGWLFAVALGLQEGKRAAVLQALIPIALGHEASIALAVVLIRGVEAVAAPDLLVLRLAGAILLVLFGAYKFLRPRSHPRWVGMRVTPPELALWSFLMSSALLTMAAVAVLVYDRLGVNVLRRAWINLDLLWAVAFVAVGVTTLFS